GKEGFSERDLLHKVLYAMIKEMVDLKKLVVELLKEGVTLGTYEQNSLYINQLYNEVKPSAGYIGEERTHLMMTLHNENQAERANDYMSYDAQDAEEVEESLSLEEKESDLIKKALKKHKGKRKAAARELCISERTLYRKIKDLNLD